MKWLRLFVRVILALALLALLAVVLVLGPLRGRVTDVVRRQVERGLALALDAPVSIGALRIGLAPLQVEADAVVLGSDGALARAGHLRVQILPRTSLRQMRPVAEATLDDVFVDVPNWVALLEDDAPSGSPTLIPAFRLRVKRINGARVRIASIAEPLDATAAQVTGELMADALGLMHFSADVEQATLTRRGETLALARARGRGGETPSGWRLSHAEVSGDGVELASGPPSDDRLPIRGRIALPQLAFASDVFERMRGVAEIDVALIGRLEKPAAGGSVRVADFAFADQSFGTVSADAEWNLRELKVSAARLARGDGNAEASGTLTLDEPFKYQAQVRWAGLDLPGLLQLPPQATKPFTATGDATLSGTLEPLVVQAEGGGRMIAAQSAAPLEWRGRGSFRDGGGEGEVDASQGGGNRLRAALGVGPGGSLSGDFSATVADPNALGAFLPLESVPNVSGSLSASARVSGSTAEPRLDGELDGRDVALLGVAMQKIAGRFTLDRAAFVTPGVTATLWQGSINFSGRIALDSTGENDWRAQVTDVPGDAVVGLVHGLTGSVPPIGRGKLAAQITGRGPWSRVQISGQAAMESFWLTREWIQRASVVGEITWPQWNLAAELRNTSDQSITLKGRGNAAADVTIDAFSAGWQLTTLDRGELTEMGGTLALQASLSGPMRALSGRASLRADGLILQGRQLGSIVVDGTATRGRWQLTTALLEGAIQLRAGMTPEPGGPVVLDGEWNDADFGRLLAPEAAISAVSSGALHATARLSDVARFDARATIDRLRIVNGPYELSTVAPAVLECRRGACTLNELRLQGANTDLRAAGSFSTGGPVSLRVSGDGDLRLLELAGDVVESARGRFSVDVEVGRSAGRWDVSGAMRVDQAALDVGGPAALTRTTARLSLSGTTIRIDELSGRIGTGTFAVSGEVDLARGPELTVTLTEVGADLMPSLEAEISGRVGLDGSWERMRVHGDVEISRLLYDRDIELLDFLPRLNRALADAPRPPAARRIDLDLHIVSPGELYVENNVARLEARADLRISGTVERPLIDGRIEVLDGTVTFRDRVFELQGGTVDFRPDLGLTAALNFTAESTIETPDATYTVDIRVTGTTRDPRVTMSSDDPSLSPTDVATLVAIGKTTSQLREGGGAGFSIYDALAAVPGTLSKPVQQGAKQLLPIDRISFESTYSRTTGTFEPQIKLGKDLTDELSVALGQTFGVESRTSVEADYRLTPRVYLPLTWESQTSTEAGAFGAGVKVRYEFWRITPYTLLVGWR